MITYKPFEPYTGTKFCVGGITSIKVQLANTADPAIPALRASPIFTMDGNLPGNVKGERTVGYFAGYGSTVYSIQIP